VLIILVKSPEESIYVFRVLGSVVCITSQGERTREQRMCIIISAVVVNRAEVGSQCVGVAATAKENVVRVGIAKTSKSILPPEQILWEYIGGASAMTVIDGVLDDKCVGFEIRLNSCRPCESRIWCLAPTRSVPS